MSNLGGLHTVPALLALACILAGVALVAGLCTWIVSDTSEVGDRAVLVTLPLCVVSLIASIAVALTGEGVKSMHWNDTCHRMGGVLDNGGDHGCVKPNSFISVP